MKIEGCLSPVLRASRWRALAAACLAALMLAACGGGGGDAGGSTNGGSSTSGGSTGGGGGGGGSGGGGGGGGGQVGMPSLQSSPQSATIFAGQQVVFRVEASGANLSFEWQQRRGQNPWSAATGQVSTLAGASELSVMGSAAGETYYRALIRNNVGEVTSSEARLDVYWGSVETLEPNPYNFTAGDTGGDSGAASDGGSAGGGDGDGVGAGGGLGKTLRVQIEVTRTSDGASLGSALTGATSGLVRIKAAPGTAPVLLTMNGTDAASYFDEGRKALLSYGPDQPSLHSLVTDFDQHLGVTALTEAAYRYAINHFIADPEAIRSGNAPLRRDATRSEIARLTSEQIQQAQETIRAEINRAMPERYQLISIATLPTPVDGSSGRGTITNNRYGIIQAVTGGLALVAGRDASLDKPALIIAVQLADDLTDGVVDGRSLDGRSVFEGKKAAYNPITFASDLVAAADALLNLLGGLLPLPIITAQPLSLAISAGNLATLSVQASGDGLSYQWFAGESAIADARSPSYSTSSAGTYRVVVSSAGGTVTSDSATVRVNPIVVAPTITKQPLSLTLALGASATFTVEAEGTDLVYQWFENSRGLLAQATTAILRTNIVGTYHVVVSNSAGQVQSRDVTLIALPILPLASPQRSP